MIQEAMRTRLPGGAQQVPAEHWPRYWKDELSGRLRLVVEAYYSGDQLNVMACAMIRAYLAQWIQSPVWDQPPIETNYRRELAKLRHSVRKLKTAVDIREWLSAAAKIGIDPL